MLQTVAGNSVTRDVILGVVFLRNSPKKLRTGINLLKPCLEALLVKGDRFNTEGIGRPSSAGSVQQGEYSWRRHSIIQSGHSKAGMSSSVGDTLSVRGIIGGTEE
jgi:hypothetical protein